MRLKFGLRWREAMVLAWLICCTEGAGAQPAKDAQPAVDYGNWSETEKWVWDRLKAGQYAWLDDRCTAKNLDPTKDAEAEPLWLDQCRHVTAVFLHDVLTDARWKDSLPHQGVQIVAAHVVGDLDLESAELVRPIWIDNSRIDGGVTLLRARTKSVIALTATFLRGAFNAAALNSESDVLLDTGTTFGQGVNLGNAKIGGQVSLTGATVTGTLNADALQASNLYAMSDETHRSSFGGVILRGAKIGGQVALIGANVTGNLNANALEAGALLMGSDQEYQASFRDVDLGHARIAVAVSLIGSTVIGRLNANALEAGDLYLRSDEKYKASFRDVILVAARIAGQVDMTGASVTGTFDGDTLQVGRDLFVVSDRIGDKGNGAASFSGRIKLIFAHIGGSLDARGAALADLDLSGAAIAGELRLGSTAGGVTTWHDTGGKPVSLILRDARIGGLADEPAVWQVDGETPRPVLQLDGLTINHLGGFAGGTAEQMRGRGMAWWDRWARLDPEYSPAPYAQLASAFAAIGDRDAASEIRFLGRVREREQMPRPWPWLGAMALEYVAGFGIDGYTFRVLYWIADLTIAGAAVLWLTVPAARMGHRGRIWCFGASLSRLLPIIEINKEFSDFFNDPERTRLKGWQAFAFSALGMIGWILGGILVVAVSGLTQNP